MTQRIFLLALPLLLSGCAALPALAPLLPSGSVNADMYTSTTVKLEQANFVTLKTNVVGMDKGFALFGIITMVPARFSLALDQLYERAEMRPGRPQTLANVVAERSSTFLILYSIPRVVIRADVVEFQPASPAIHLPPPPPPLPAREPVAP